MFAGDTRVSVVGTSGSGKTTIGRRIAAAFDVPFLELDSIRHQAGWIELPDEDFRARVAAFIESPEWVVDGNYSEPLDDIVQRTATLIVWLDPSRAQVMRQVIQRSFWRAITKRPLWNGNVERFSSWRHADHPIRWSWATHHPRRRRYAARMDARWVRLRSRREINRWLRELAGSTRAR